MSSIQSIRGMKDLLPTETPLWQWVENHFRKISQQYGYQEIRLPILEPINLFERAVGESTDIVSKEMYDFIDKSGNHITLRPEGTSGCVRSIIENNMCYNATQRLWYQGPMFRYERPQKGRLRQFTQIGVETFGMSGPDVDAELILMSRDLFHSLGIVQRLRLEINSLGTPNERAAHRAELIAYFTANKALLDEDSLQRLALNPLRILDSKNPGMQEMLNAAPQLIDHLQDESLDHFNKLCRLLDDMDIEYTINPRLVRGLDYYSRTVFEWISEDLGSQGTVCGGGRYDGLVELFGAKPLPASGFAIGLERLILLMNTLEIGTDIKFSPDIVVTSENRDDSIKALQIANKIRHSFPMMSVLSDYTGTKLKRQHQQACKSGCKIVITLNADDSIGIWDLTSDNKARVNSNNICDELKHIIKN